MLHKTETPCVRVITGSNNPKMNSRAGMETSAAIDQSEPDQLPHHAHLIEC